MIISCFYDFHLGTQRHDIILAFELPAQSATSEENGRRMDMICQHYLLIICLTMSLLSCQDTDVAFS